MAAANTWLIYKSTSELVSHMSGWEGRQKRSQSSRCRRSARLWKLCFGNLLLF